MRTCWAFWAPCLYFAQGLHAPALAARAEYRNLGVNGGRRLPRHRRVDHDMVVPFMVLLSLLNLIAATQDIATDGLAVSRLALCLRGLGNSVQVIGYKIGMVLGGGVLLVLVMPASAFPCRTPRVSSVVRL
jgi:hypothetical protein